MQLLNWNLEWNTPRSRHASVIRGVLERADLDVVCLTETTTEWLAQNGGAIEAEADYGYGLQPRRRKVALWAREGFTSTTNASPAGMPSGRFASGVTKDGVRVVGVCIPWKDAHVRTGRRDRAPWDEHVEYLAALGRYLATLREERICVVGDFNQTMPRSRAPRNVHDAMVRAFAGFEIVTAGREVDAPMKLVDHVAVSAGGQLASWEQLPIVSDHVGWVGEVRFG